MQISANLILDFRNDVEAFAKSLYNKGNEPEIADSALADALQDIGGTSAVPERNILTIQAEYVEKFADELKIGGLDRYASKRIAKEMAEKVLIDVMRDIEDI